MAQTQGNIIWLASYPKSGNTWFRAFYTNLILNRDEPAHIDELLPSDIASSRKLFDDFSGINGSNLTHGEMERLRPLVYESLSGCSKDPIFMKIHDAYTKTGDGTPLVSVRATRSAIYFIRNPLDVAVSFAHHSACDIDTMIEKMADNTYGMCTWQEKIVNQIPQKLLSWSDHVTSWVDGMDSALHLIRYEDLVIDTFETFRKAVLFADLPDDPERIRKAIAFSEFRELRKQEKKSGFREKNRKSESFFRKGMPGSWREVLTADQAKRIIHDHRAVMKRFGYLDDGDEPVF